MLFSCQLQKCKWCWQMEIQLVCSGLQRFVLLSSVSLTDGVEWGAVAWHDECWLTVYTYMQYSVPVHKGNYTHLTCTVHALSMNTTHRLHAFYSCVDAAVPFTGTVIVFMQHLFQNQLVLVGFFQHGSYAYFFTDYLYLISFYNGDKVMCCVACIIVLLVEVAGLSLLTVKQTCFANTSCSLKWLGEVKHYTN